MQSVLSKIWTRLVMSISNDDNHYTTGTSLLYFSIYIFVKLVLMKFCGEFVAHGPIENE